MTKRVTIFIAIMSVVSQSATAENITNWLNPVDGSWANGTAWDTGIAPSINNHAVLGHAGSYRVSIDSLSSVASLSITNKNAALSILDGQSLTLHGDIFNQGEIAVSELNGALPTVLYIGESVSLFGNGVLKLPALSGNSRISSVGNAVLTQGPMHTIEGQGFFVCSMFNQGTIRANVPGEQIGIYLMPLTNEGRLEAVNDGLVVLATAVEQSNSGVIAADGEGSQVQLAVSLLKGGTLSTSNGGEILIVSDSDIEDVTNEGTLRVNRYRSLGVSGALTNNGDIKLDEVHQASPSSLYFQSDTQILGNGQIDLGTDRVGVMTVQDESITVTNGADHTIHGNGRVIMSLINEGLIHADVPGGKIVVAGIPAMVNNSIIKVSNGSKVQVGGDIHQFGDGIVLADGPGSLIDFTGNMFGGKIQTLNGGLFETRGFTMLDSVEIVSGSTALFTWSTDIQNQLTNNGIIEIGSGRRAYFLNNSILQGTGEIHFLPSSGNIGNPPGMTVTQGANHTIRGRGIVSASMINDGLIVADLPGFSLDVTFKDKSNNGRMEAINGATLNIGDIHIAQGEAGVIQAIGEGSVLALHGANISGGTLSVSDGAVFDYDAPYSILNDVTLFGDLEIVNKPLSVFSSLTNNGRITLRKEGIDGGTIPKIGFTFDVLLDGTGSVVLDSAQTGPPMIETIVDGILTNAAEHTIEGRGRIAAIMINNGLIRANVPDERLVITGNSHWSGSRTINNAIVEATNGGELYLDPMTQSSTGVIRAVGPGSVVSMHGTIVLGRLETADGGLISVQDDCGLVTVGMQAHVEIQSRWHFSMLGDMTNDGFIDINPLAGDEVTTLQWGDWRNGVMVIGGEGVIRLSAPGDRSRIYAFDTSDAGLGPNQRLEGIGQIAMNLFNAGTIAPGLGIGTMTAINPVEFLSTSQFEAEIASDSNDILQSTSSVALGGAINILFVDGFTNSNGYWAKTIISGESITGEFAEFNIPLAADGLRTRIYNTGTQVIVGQSCLADYNLDGIVDFFDVSEFLQLFGREAGNADLNNDGRWDFFDITLFLSDLGNGCKI